MFKLNYHDFVQFIFSQLLAVDNLPLQKFLFLEEEDAFTGELSVRFKVGL